MQEKRSTFAARVAEGVVLYGCPQLADFVAEVC
jgi:hypothetical protein